MKYIKTAAILLLLVMALWLFLYVRTKIVHVEYADVYLKDLPQQFDGTKVLYVSDIHISSRADLRRTQKLMSQLQAAEPDLLLLGGDYTDLRLWDRYIFSPNESIRNMQENTVASLRDQWFSSLAQFRAPLGKFAVMGNHDGPEEQEIALPMAKGGVQLLVNQAITIKKGNAELVIAGVGDYSSELHDPEATARQVRADQCCILLSHNPDLLPQMYNIDSHGGAWIDLALCGHTHGGQVRFGSWVPINKSEYGDDYLSGWSVQPSGWSLTSNGVGTTALPIRIGAPAQAHIITLHRAMPVE